MIIVMKPKFSEDNLRNVINTIEGLGLTAHLSRGEHTTLVGVVGDKRRLLEKNPELFPGVDRVIQVSETYKLANKKFKAEPTIIDVDGVKIGGDNFVIMAGPCAVESHDQLMQTAAAAKAGGAQILRGGAYKPRTSPYSFQGLEVEGLKYMAEAREATGLKVITEVTSEHALEAAVNYVDIIQIGARNMQNFELLKEAGKINKPVIRRYGFVLGHQMMVGLPDSTLKDEIKTAEDLIKLKPKIVRIYPVLVIKKTILEKEYKAGEYEPLTVDQAVERSKEMVKLFNNKKINVIRIGLQNTEEITDPNNPESEVVAGPYHPAFRQLVESSIWYDEMVSQIKKFNTKVEKVRITANEANINNIIGHKKSNIIKLKDIYNVDVIVKPDEKMKKGKFKIDIEEFHKNFANVE